MKKDKPLIIFINDKNQTIDPDKDFIEKCQKIFQYFKLDN